MINPFNPHFLFTNSFSIQSHLCVLCCFCATSKVRHPPPNHCPHATPRASSKLPWAAVATGENESMPYCVHPSVALCPPLLSSSPTSACLLTKRFFLTAGNLHLNHQKQNSAKVYSLLSTNIFILYTINSKKDNLCNIRSIYLHYLFAFGVQPKGRCAGHRLANNEECRLCGGMLTSRYKK